MRVLLFLSTLSLRRATHGAARGAAVGVFLSTLSLRRATVAPLLATGSPRYFYPRSPCGERLNEDRYGQQFWRFLSTLSLRRATADQAQDILTALFLSTLSLRRATLAGRKLVKANTGISIHALLAESDDVIAVMTDAQSISIHALLAESDREPTALRTPHQRFLSTLSLRRATANQTNLPGEN